jgi:hypothetical protein
MELENVIIQLLLREEASERQRRSIRKAEKRATHILKVSRFSQLGLLEVRLWLIECQFGSFRVFFS